LSERKFATGTWVFGMVGDRFLLSGYRKGLDVLERIASIAEIEGISGVELLYPADFADGVDRVDEAIEGTGLDCAAVGVDLAGDPRWKFGSLSSKDARIRNEAIELIKNGMDVASSLGTKRVNIWPGQDGYDYAFEVDYSNSWEWFVEGISSAASYRSDVLLCVEYKPREPRIRSLIDTSARALLLCNEVGLGNVGVTVDIGHAIQAGENIAEVIHMLSRARKLFHIHLNDNRGGWDDDMILGSVRLVEFLEMVDALDRVGYDGWLSVDVYPYREDPQKVVAESVSFFAFLDRLLERIGKEAIDQARKGDDPVSIFSTIRKALSV